MPNQPAVAKRGEVCPRCGIVHPRCLAHSSTSKKACNRHPTPGADVCPIHGGSTKSVRRKAAEHNVITQATGLLSKYGDVQPVANPLDALLRLAGRAERLLLAIEERVDILGSIRYEGASGEQLRAEVAAYLTLLDRSRAILVDILRLGLEERLVRLDEKQADLIADVFRQVLEDPEFGLEERQREVGRDVVSRHLRVLGSKQAAV